MKKRNLVEDGTPDAAPSDEELLLLSAEGDETAFAELFRRYAAPLRGFLIQLLKRPALAEDVLQEVFLQAWSKAADYDVERGRVSTWLFLLARSRATDHLRSSLSRFKREQRRAKANERQKVVDPGDRLTASLSTQKLMGVLSEPQMQFLQMTFFGGLSISQAARRLEIPLGTGKSRYRSGLRRLRAAAVPLN